MIKLDNFEQYLIKKVRKASINYYRYELKYQIVRDIKLMEYRSYYDGIGTTALLMLTNYDPKKEKYFNKINESILKSTYTIVMAEYKAKLRGYSLYYD